MRTVTEEQLQKLKDVGWDRLSPDGMSAFLAVTFIYSSFMNLIPFFADRSHEVQIAWISVIVNLFLGLWIIQGAFALFFLSLDRAFRYQRLQAVVTNCAFIKLTLDGYLLYLVDVKEKRSVLLWLGLASLVLGIVYMLWSVRRARINIAEGEARREGQGLLYAGNFKAWTIIPIVFIIALFITAIIFTFTGIGNIWFLFLIAPLQWILGYVYPEYYFFAYCKWVHPSFIFERPQARKKG
ncbi:hypothetical protein D3P09_24605 [Paenibacillus pinisoli]|uniref:Uncharacterized protein n=1 Tax=Paenibacillus pinisoli TaxID=1276110 RepID=A0A3A6PBN0_9BACL|nr:hypothetical protein [Paenibacillus pinisoli]RJX37096.1 hypothetical protein D3P09_24605 [Paenibacillus pinisoli]